MRSEHLYYQAFNWQHPNWGWFFLGAICGAAVAGLAIAAVFRPRWGWSAAGTILGAGLMGLATHLFHWRLW